LPLDNNLKKRILLRANYRCENEFCTKPKPFKKEDKTTYLEFHHIIPYCECRKHEYENIVVLFPNCHKQVHFGEKAEIEKIKSGFQHIFNNL
jgi:5-methylcytosine-specific restriction protein A